MNKYELARAGWTWTTAVQSRSLICKSALAMPTPRHKCANKEFCVLDLRAHTSTYTMSSHVKARVQEQYTRECNCMKHTYACTRANANIQTCDHFTSQLRSILKEVDIEGNDVISVEEFRVAITQQLTALVRVVCCVSPAAVHPR